MNNKIAILYTTFMRDELMKRTCLSIIHNWKPGFYLLVGDQGNLAHLPALQPQTAGMKWFALPYDCGLSYARNRLVQEAASQNFEFCLLTADSIEFIPETIKNLDKVITFMKNNRKIGIVGFNLKAAHSWVFNMDIGDGKFLMKKIIAGGIDAISGLNFMDCDICPNFFLARTQALINVPWDNELKLMEHEDFFWRFKQSGWKVAWTPDVSALHIHDWPEEYAKFRYRAYGEFMKKLKKKYNLQDWVEYVK